MRGEKQSQAEFEAEIEGDTGEHRNELRIEQIAPAFRVPRAAYVPLRADRVESVRANLESSSEWMQGTMRVLSKEKLGDSEYYAGLPEGTYLEICHHSDRTYVGYANLYRKLVELAPLLEDARFVIKEDYASAVDEYRIEGGTLRFERGFAADEYADDFRAYLASEARARDRDAELRSFAAWLLADHAEFMLDRDLREAARELRVAKKLAPDDPEVTRRAAWLAWREGRPKAADRLFAKSLEAEPRSRVALERACAALTAYPKERKTARLRRERIARAALAEATAPRDAATAALAALLVGSDDRELAARAFGVRDAGPIDPLLAETRRIEELAKRYVGALAAGAVPPSEPVAREVLRWAELFRIRYHHGKHPKRAAMLALDFYEKAAAIHPLDGDVEYHRGYLLRSLGRKKRAIALWESSLELHPDHGETLGELGVLAHDAGDLERALELFGRYLEVVKSGYARGVYANYFVHTLCLKGAAQLREKRYEEGLATFEEAARISLPWSSTPYIGPLVGRADALSLSWRADEALPIAEEAVKLAPESTHAHSCLALALHRLGRFDEALRAADRAHELDPKYFHPIFMRAIALARTGGDVRVIVKLLRKAVRREPPLAAHILDRDDDVLPGLREAPEVRALERDLRKLIAKRRG
jgi:tetratricopeptide (TPR) repeat protein